MIKGKIDLGDMLANLDKLDGPGKESLARRMGVAAAREYRREAEVHAPVGKTEASAQAQYGGSKRAGSLKAALYAAYNKKQETDTKFVYSVSWNRKLAPHGHLLEFGHWQPFAVIYSPKFGWVTDKSNRLPGQGKWVAARPFLGVAYHSAQKAAFAAATEAGIREFPKILAGETE